MIFFLFFLFFLLKFLIIMGFFTISLLVIFVFFFVFVLLSVAVLTLLERKVMAAAQRRKGPATWGPYGLYQPMADAIKLLAKESVVPGTANYLIFILSPVSIFIFSLLCWTVIPFGERLVYADLSISMLFVFALSSAGVYSVVMAGWSSNSKYSFLGSLRSAAQMISYEVSLGLIIMPVLVFAQSTNFIKIVLFQFYFFNFFILMPSFFLFFICILAETNSVPFDLPEAESELVSGYNVEYSSVGFVLFFLAEYLNIILMSVIIVILFFGGWLPFFSFFPFSYVPGFFWFFFKIVVVIYLFIWARVLLPRFSYDQLMDVGWKIILPFSLALLFFSIFFLYFFGVVWFLPFVFF